MKIERAAAPAEGSLKRMGMLEQLSGYYRKNGILSTSFTCAHKKQCRGDCASFTGPKSAFVSGGYEHGALPRLLFLSLDSGSGEKDDQKRLPAALRKQEESRDVEALPKHKHWYRTHELAWYVLRRFKPDMKLEEAKHYFAHANSAKCCMNNPQRKKADAVLFRNCRPYLHEELVILSPDLIITQGAEAQRAVQSIIAEVKRKIDAHASIVEFNSRLVFWLHTYHPSCWGRFNRQRSFSKKTNRAEGWDRYSRLMHQFLMRHRDAPPKSES